MMHAVQHGRINSINAAADPEHVIGTLLIDAGYTSDANLAAPGPDRMIALGRGKYQARCSCAAAMPVPPGPDARAPERMRCRLRTKTALGSMARMASLVVVPGPTAITAPARLPTTGTVVLRSQTAPVSSLGTGVAVNDRGYQVSSAHDHERLSAGGPSHRCLARQV